MLYKVGSFVKVLDSKELMWGNKKIYPKTINLVRAHVKPKNFSFIHHASLQYNSSTQFCRASIWINHQMWFQEHRLWRLKWPSIIYVVMGLQEWRECRSTPICRTFSSYYNGLLVFVVLYYGVHRVLLFPPLSHISWFSCMTIYMYW